MIENARMDEQPPAKEENPRTAQDVILEAVFDVANRELKVLEEMSDYKTKRYTVSLRTKWRCYSNGDWASDEGNF